MASSSYYYSQYVSCRDQVTEYSKNVNVLTRIKNSLTNDFFDEQSNVNKELGDLKDDLMKSVRHDSKFTNIASECESYREKATTADEKMNAAVINLENEIAALNGKKETAEQERDAQYQNYLNAKQEEYNAWLNSLRN